MTSSSEPSTSLATTMTGQEVCVEQAGAGGDQKQRIDRKGDQENSDFGQDRPDHAR